MLTPTCHGCAPCFASLHSARTTGPSVHLASAATTQRTRATRRMRASRSACARVPTRHPRRRSRARCTTGSSVTRRRSSQPSPSRPRAQASTRSARLEDAAPMKGFTATTKARTLRCACARSSARPFGATILTARSARSQRIAQQLGTIAPRTTAAPIWRTRASKRTRSRTWPGACAGAPAPGLAASRAGSAIG